MFQDFLRNPLVILHATAITFLLSFWTIIELLLKKVSRKSLDDRLCWWAKKLLSNINLEWSIHKNYNSELANGKPYIVMSNHCSYYDIPLSILAMEGRIRMVAKKELLQIPIWGKAMQLTDFVSIDRFNPRQALKDMKYAKKIMEKGVVLWISPEGTRSKTGELLPFKSGGFRLAIECGAAIIPMAIKGSGHVMAAHSLVVNKDKKVDVFVGKPIDTTDYRKRDRQKLMQDVEAQINSLMKQPSSGQSTDHFIQ